MFIGHYGVSFAARRVDASIPLWILFLAVQLLDVAWAPFVLLGIEKVRIVPGFTASNPLDLYYMPYTHSLPAALLWALGAALAYRFLVDRRGGMRAAVVIGLAVFSHWILDVIVHRPDLPLYGDRAKIGLGLWNLPVIAFALEAALLFGGMWLYFDAAPKLRKGMVLFGIVMLAVQALVFFGPPPASDHAAALKALVAYVVFAAVARILEGNERGTPSRISALP